MKPLTGLGVTVLMTSKVVESFTELRFSSQLVSFLAGDRRRVLRPHVIWVAPPQREALQCSGYCWGSTSHARSRSCPKSPAAWADSDC